MMKNKLANKFRIILLLGGIVLLSACATMNMIYPPFTDLNFKAAPELNPDLKGRPSPVVVKIYELGSRTIFDGSDFFVLYEKPQTVLKGDLLSKDELEFRPGQQSTHRLTLNKGTKYIGLIVAYRDISNSRWRAVIPADADGHDKLDVYLEKLSIYIKEK
ncbi:type VI secretion system lipoprotein TssJ [Aliikangiella maris]|uniref:Type VI secretion system lipoprotein TssJ n=2 Tax=Aliikangiella maris TaxID=3162458 RepID=A0ABV2BSN3_9GAMM